MATSFAPSDSQGGGVKLSLFANQIIRFAMIGAGCAFSIYLGLQITNPDANGLATSVEYVAAAAFIAAVVSPRTGIFLVLFMCPCLDLVKRLLILYSDASMMDVTVVLAMAPVTMAGAVIGTFLSRLILKKTLFEPGEKPLFLLVLMTSSLMILSSVMHEFDSKLSLLRDLGESCIYLTLIYLVPVHFPTPKQIAVVFRCIILAFLPVALYGFWQQIFGLSDFENRYLLSGLTVTTGDYLENGRIFSTLNSNHAFSVTMACCAIIAWLLRYLPAERPRSAWMKSFAWVFGLVFAAACLVSLRRTGWLVMLFSAGGAFCFRSRRRTQIFYIACLSILLLLIFNAAFIYTQLPYWDSVILSNFPGSADSVHLQTFNERLFSFQTLTDNKLIWTAFGMSPSEMEGIAVHDAITQTVMGYGVVGTLVFLGFLTGGLVVSHRVVWKSTDPIERNYMALLLSLIFANIFVGAVMQSHIGIFPVNFLFWICAGALTTATFKKPAVEAAAFDLETLRAIIESSSKGKKLLTAH
jgi:hypothetical protein